MHAGSNRLGHSVCGSAMPEIRSLNENYSVDVHSSQDEIDDPIWFDCRVDQDHRSIIRSSWR